MHCLDRASFLHAIQTTPLVELEVESLGYEACKQKKTKDVLRNIDVLMREQFRSTV